MRLLVLSEAAVAGVNPATAPELPACPPWEEREFRWEEVAYPDLIQQHIRAVIRERERRDKQAAFLLFGVHF